MPRGLQEQTLKVRNAQERLTNEHGHAPTVGQLAEFLELDTEDVLDTLQALQAYETVSLDAPPPSAEDEAMTYGDALGRNDERYELIELDATVTAALAELPERERLILHMRFVEDLTQTEIAAQIGVSQMQVSRLLRRSLDQLRALSDVAAGT
jgi:RNA polymerase sigma-B factor